MASERDEDTVYKPTHSVLKTSLQPSADKDPSLPSTAPTTSNEPRIAFNEDSIKKRKSDRFINLYDKETGACLGRTCKSWISILLYSVMYLIFLWTFTLVVLYSSLEVLKLVVDYNNTDFYNVKYELLTYPLNGIGLTAVPTAEANSPLIWYKNGEKHDYDKYVEALDKLLSSNRRKREVSSLGPCGQSPYGYGEKPCVIVRINKLLKWVGQPLQFNSTIAKLAPAEVQTWIRADKTKLWLHCGGYYAYDKEHIGRIKYYPDPPGFDADMFPLDVNKQSPLVAIQISEFTIGISLAIRCTLWYDAGPSTIDFVLYVAPRETITNTSVNA